MMLAISSQTRTSARALPASMSQATSSTKSTRSRWPFVAGVAMDAGFILQYIAAGTVWVEDRLRILPVVWIGSGLLLAALTGAASIIVGDPFLTSYFRYVDLPILGKVPLASATVFDLGVFGLVVGATVLMLIAIAHQSIRRLRAARLEEERQSEEQQLWS